MRPNKQSPSAVCQCLVTYFPRSACDHQRKSAGRGNVVLPRGTAEAAGRNQRGFSLRGSGLACSCDFQVSSTPSDLDPIADLNLASAAVHEQFNTCNETGII